ncbi:MAG: DNA alkylation repair protein [Bacteroidales bacterium]|nr:DNA alkylation repair protein [Bacteroidales bacterium]
MAEQFLLKNIFNSTLLERLTNNITKAWHGFPAQEFLGSTLPNFEPLSLTGRANLIADALEVLLPKDYAKAIKIIENAFEPENPDNQIDGYGGFLYMPFSIYIYRNGLGHFNESMHAMYELTKRFTAEFAIRTFIENHYEKTMQTLHTWAFDKNVHVRRLVSEGTRPRLPWAPRLPKFVKDPGPVIELLDKLKEDPELYVRRSVANNLNDIAKDNPQQVLTLLAHWNQLKNNGTKWIVKHATRTLIKQGYTDALTLLGHNPEVVFEVTCFTVDAKVKIGQAVSFAFTISNPGNETIDLLIDYILHF